MAALDFARLEAEVARDEQVNSSAATLIASLAEEIRAGAGDQARMLALADRLEASQQSLAAAVEANTGGTGGGGGEEPVDPTPSPSA
jgi:uncharacterized coiled-coil protein SlyX